MSRRKHSTRPRDVKAWWKAAHCRPETADATEICGFCGANVLDCAAENSASINERGIELGGVNEDGCGGSGFWCRGCGRFWAQDSCGESSGAEHSAADGAKLKIGDDDFVHCVCGKRLMRLPEGDD